jgi:dihydroorotase
MTSAGNPKTLVRGATVVFPEGPRIADVLFSADGLIDVDASRSTAADEVIDGSGKWLLPGVIDDQVHFREPGLTHKEDLSTASHACAAGGVTTFLEMPNTKPPAITREGVRDKERIAAGKSLVNYGFYIGATPFNVDELAAATDFPGIKIFIGGSPGRTTSPTTAGSEM